MDTLANIFKNLYLTLQLCFIFLYEYIIYYFKSDSITFIDRLTKRLARINILYVKIFQACALNNSLIDEEINNKLLEFTDRAPWTIEDIDYKTLSLIEKEYDLDFENNYIPINSGMISLVFKAFNKYTGEKMIVKMKRKNIETKLNESVNHLIFLIRLFSHMKIIKKYQLNQVIIKNIETIKHQINFVEEVTNMMIIKKNCINLKYVKIPTADLNITEKYPNIIIMDYIEGASINKIDKNDYEDFAKQVLKFGFVTTLLHGFTHGDLHSGNILFIKDELDPKYKYKIGVLDFGIMYNVDIKQKEMLFDVLTDLFNIEPDIAAERILLCGFFEPIDVIKNMPRDHYDGIVKLISGIIDDIVVSSRKANQLQIYKFIHDLKTYLTKNNISDLGIRLSDSFVRTQLVLAMAHGVTLTLCKDNYMELADKVLNDLFHTNMMI
jgi:predicted unusual protein kinase regulating ubiquinone biosynthesis (AarF/ABC1/UbiB family)